MPPRILTDAQTEALRIDDAAACDAAFALAAEDQLEFAIMVCATDGRPRCLAHLLLRPNALAVMTGDGQSLLHLAARFGCIEIMEMLVDHGLDVNARTNSGMTPLMMAAGGSRVEAVRYLLLHGADRSLTNRHGKTAHEIAQGPRRAEVKSVLETVAED